MKTLLLFTTLFINVYSTLANATPAAAINFVESFAKYGIPAYLTPKELTDICLAGGFHKPSAYGVCETKATDLPKAICLAAGIDSSTYGVCATKATDLPKAICLAGGIDPSTYGVCVTKATDLSKAVCLAGGVDPSTYGVCATKATDLPKGLCLAKGYDFYKCQNISMSESIALPSIDTEWSWDRFKDPNSYDNLWRCRGKRTGKFSDDTKCSGYKSDDTWPNN
jgi:hypothetical protein